MARTIGRGGGVRSLLLYLAASFGAATVGGLATAGAIPTWYRSLRKPRWNPPDRVFGPVWTVLYTQMAVAAWLVDRGRARRLSRAAVGRSALRLWWLQLALNVAWSIAFFGRRRPAWGLLVIAPLWTTIASTTLLAGQVSRAAGALLLPYLVWTGFAWGLNLRVWQLNRSPNGTDERPVA